MNYKEVIARKVIVAHPGQQHSYQTALAMQEAGLLDLYLTGFYYKPDHFASTIINALPEGYRQAILRELKRRYLTGLDTHRIRSHALVELAQVIAGRLRRSSDPSLMLYRNENFQRWVKKLIARRRPTAVIGYDTSALEIFRSAKALGALCILDQTIADRRFGLELLQEEAVLHPDLASTLTLEHMERTVRLSIAEAETAEVILAGSRFVCDSLARRGIDASKIVVMPYGAEPSKVVHARLDDGCFRIVFVGSISQRKGIKYLLEAVRRLSLPSLRLDLVGPALSDMTNLAPYRHLVTFHGNVPRAEVAEHLARADLCVYPSLFEGSALAIYEAMAAGLPVITTPNSGSIVRDGIDGFIVPIRDIQALISKITLLYENRSLSKQMGENARKRAEDFTWVGYRQRLGDFVDDLLRRHVIKPSARLPFHSPAYMPGSEVAS
jgi:alpha-maltose-1-phosphate synthase